MIHIHTQTDQSTIGYVTYMLSSMVALADDPTDLKVTIHCLDERSVVMARDVAPPNASVVMVSRPIWLIDNGSLAGSSGHAAGVEDAFRSMTDGDIHIVADGDTVVLMPKWDVHVKDVLSAVGIFGVTYEAIGGFSSGTAQGQTYKDIPNVVWCAFAPGHPWDKLQAQPCKDGNIDVTDVRLSRVYNLPIGHSVFRDVAWQIPEFLDTHGIKYMGMKQLKPTKDAIVLKGLSDYHEEYHFNGEPFVVHQRGSLRHAFRQAKVSKQFYDAVDAYMIMVSTDTLTM